MQAAVSVPSNPSSPPRGRRPARRRRGRPAASGPCRAIPRRGRGRCAAGRSTGTTGIAPPCSAAAATTAVQRSTPASGRAPSWIATTSTSPEVDVGLEHPDRRPLGGVPGRPAVDDEHLAVTQVGRHGRLDGVPVLGPHDEDEASYVRERERVAHRPHQHRGVAQGEQDLVDLGAHPAAGAGGEDHDGDGHAPMVGEPASPPQAAQVHPDLAVVGGRHEREDSPVRQ